MRNRCAKCSLKQKEAAIRIVEYLIKNEPEDWKELNKKFDPDGIYIQTYLEEARQFG